MDILLVPLLLLAKSILSLLMFILVTDIILSFLLAGNVFNTNNQFVYSLIESIRKVSDFMCEPVRKRFPVLVGSFDFSPIIVMILISFFEHVIARILMRMG